MYLQIRYNNTLVYLLLPIILSQTGNCSNQQNQTLTTVASSGQRISVEYQFRIQLSSSDPCHCVTLESATNDFGLDIKREWDIGNFWCSNNSTFLCASKTENRTFYSKRLLPDGIQGIINTLNGNTCSTEGSTDEDQSEGVNVCPESTSKSIVDTLTGHDQLQCPQDGNWISSLNCSIISGIGLTNTGCTNNSNG